MSYSYRATVQLHHGSRAWHRAAHGRGTTVTAHGTQQSLPCRGLLGQVAAVTDATALGARIAAAVVLRDYLAKRKDKR